MCEIISAVAMVAATAMQMYGQHQAGQAAQKQAGYQSKIAKNNAQVAEWQAQDALDRGEQAEVEQRRKTRQLMGNQRVVMAANGFDVNTGMNVDLLGDTALMGEADALAIRQNAQREAYGHEVGAANALAQADMATYEGKVAKKASVINMGSTLLSAASQFDWKGTFGTTPTPAPAGASVKSNDNKKIDKSDSNKK